jgi:hypothetical protein
MKASLVTRLIVTLLAFPMLYLYIHLEKRRKDVSIEDRPVLSILRRIADMEEELNEAQAEIERRKQAEAALQKALSEVKSLKGMLPICAACKSIRNDEGFWEKIETYIRNQTDAEFSHGICPECQNKYYRDLV